MKRLLFILAMAGMLLSSCEKGEDDNGNSGNNGNQTNQPSGGNDNEDKEEVIAVENISLNATTIELFPNNEFQLQATTTPTGVDVSYKSGDNAIATVSEAGIIKAVGVGQTTITASAADKSAFCTVNVKPESGYTVSTDENGKPICYTVYTAEGLRAWADKVNDENMDKLDCILANDIIMPEPQDEKGNIISVAYQRSGYNGVFDGQGHRISGVVVTRGYENNGFFSILGSGIIKNVHIEGSVEGYVRVGGIVGRNKGGTIIGCSFSGKVIATYDKAPGSHITGEQDAFGGICGMNQGHIIACYNLAEIIGGHGCGGIAGTNWPNYAGNITHSETKTALTACYNTAIVKNDPTLPKLNFIEYGGIAGLSFNHKFPSADPYSCTACYYNANNNIKGIGAVVYKGNYIIPVIKDYHGVYAITDDWDTAMTEMNAAIDKYEQNNNITIEYRYAKNPDTSKADVEPLILVKK